MNAEWLELQQLGRVRQLSSQVEDLTSKVSGFLSPVGAIQLWAGASDNSPEGWIVCDGSSLLKISYPELYAIIGSAFGSVDVDHFTLPDFRGKFPFGVSPANVIGSSGGSKTITTDNMPNHNHLNTASSTGIIATNVAETGLSISNAFTGLTITSTANLPDHTHNYTRPNASNLSGVPIGAPSMNGTTDVASGGVNGQPVAISISNSTNDPQHTHGIVEPILEGGGSGHKHTITDPTHTHTSGMVGGGADYLQPYVSVFYIICYTTAFPITLLSPPA